MWTNPSGRNRRALVCHVALIASLGVITARGATAQESHAPDALVRTVSDLDTELFRAFNACDVNTLSTLVADDLEFFHDKDGLSVGRQAFLDSTQKNICGKVQRDLVPNTLEVYPLGDYGALEIGVHRFRHPGHDDTESLGEARFVIVWRRNGSGWTMTRTISYAHGLAVK